MPIPANELKRCGTCGKDFNPENPVAGVAQARRDNVLRDILVCYPCSDKIKKDLAERAASN